MLRNMENIHTKEALAQAKQGQWGRASHVQLQSFLGCLFIITLTPWLVFYFYISAFAFDCSLSAPILALLSGNLSLQELWTKLPRFSYEALLLWCIWVGLQIILAAIPDIFHLIFKSYKGGEQLGAVTPAGKRLWYNINGLQAWFVSHVLFLAGAFYFELFSPTIIFDNWGSLLVVANVAGFCLAIFAYIKAYYFPSFPEDRKFSGNFLYDFFMGIELNPRIGAIDFKLFFNGRPGIVAWTMINFSFAAAQYNIYGYVTNSMILVSVFHGLYVLYFFAKEQWYLNTIDIHHDHFGWMLAWGDCVWLPYMYTLQGLFLVFHPIELPTYYALFVLALGILGFWIFLSSNNQKDRFRSKDGKVLIWGKEPSFIPCMYTTKDGELRHSKLLVSGWWGLARHMNYTGDLILSLAYSLACGFDFLFPYFYFIFMSILLIHRCIRDEHRCSHKYGSDWSNYCARVRYRILPGIF